MGTCRVPNNSCNREKTVILKRFRNFPDDIYISWTKQVLFARLEIGVTDMPVLLGSLLSRCTDIVLIVLLQSICCAGFFSIDYYDILEGLSNGLELLHFISDALEQSTQTETRYYPQLRVSSRPPSGASFA